jgi:hypothetical protein
VQEMKDSDKAKPLYYCQWFCTSIEENEVAVLDDDLFTDEAQFNPRGFV